MVQELPAEGVVLGWRPPGQGGADTVPVGSMEDVEDLGRGDPGEGGPCLATGSGRHPLGKLQAGRTLPPSGGLEGKCGWPQSQARLRVLFLKDLHISREVTHMLCYGSITFQPRESHLCGSTFSVLPLS